MTNSKVGKWLGGTSVEKEDPGKKRAEVSGDTAKLLPKRAPASLRRASRSLCTSSGAPLF